MNPSIIMAGVELYRTTGRAKYLDMANFFIDWRGSRYGDGRRDTWAGAAAKGSDLNQNWRPLRKETEVVGHAVFFTYLYAGAADPLVEQTRNQVAVMRGPIVYCLESVDLPQGTKLEEICLPVDAKWEVRREPDLLGGVTVLKTNAMLVETKNTNDIGGYRQVSDVRLRPIAITLIPYYAWNNREEPEMTVWLPVV